MTVQLPPMSPGQTAAWSALVDLHRTLPRRWTLVGGQMVHLHCAERGAAPTRPTDDLDAVLDVRAHPHVLREFTGSLAGLGFEPAGTSPQGHQHRWVRTDGAAIDVLIPQHLGRRAGGRTGAGGGTTLATPAAQQALDRSQDVDIRSGELSGTVRRPNLLGALVGKAAAHTIPLDTARSRHRSDFIVLATLIAPSDQVERATVRDRRYLGTMIAAVREDRRTLYGIEGGVDAIDLLADILRPG